MEAALFMRLARQGLRPQEGVGSGGWGHRPSVGMAPWPSLRLGSLQVCRKEPGRQVSSAPVSGPPPRPPELSQESGNM